MKKNNSSSNNSLPSRTPSPNPVTPYHIKNFRNGILAWLIDPKRNFNYHCLLTYARKEYDPIRVSRDLENLQTRLTNAIYGRKRDQDDPWQTVSLLGFIESHSDGSLHVHVLFEPLGPKAPSSIQHKQKTYNLKRKKCLSKLITDHWIRLQLGKTDQWQRQAHDAIAAKTKKTRDNHYFKKTYAYKKCKQNDRMFNATLNRLSKQSIRARNQQGPLQSMRQCLAGNTLSKSFLNIKPKTFKRQGRYFLEVVFSKVSPPLKNELYQYFCKEVSRKSEHLIFTTLRTI